jgi:hypothetical protein
VTPDVIAIRSTLSQTDTETPATKQKADATSTRVTGIADGVWYFLLQFKNDSGWGAIAKYKVQIDTVPPAAFDIALLASTSSAAAPMLAFKAEDALSGVDHYGLIVGSTTDVSINANDMSNGTYPVPPQEGGPQLVTVKAYDKAGNMTASSKTLTLPKVLKPVVKTTEDAPPPPSPWVSFDRVISILLALIAGSLASWNMNAKKAAASEKSKLLKLVNEAGDKNDRVFSAMREEFEQMINDFDKKPQLTPEERELLENIKEVIDISEELIDGGIEELKKEIRGQ